MFHFLCKKHFERTLNRILIDDKKKRLKNIFTKFFIFEKRVLNVRKTSLSFSMSFSTRKRKRTFDESDEIHVFCESITFDNIRVCCYNV